MNLQINRCIAINKNNKKCRAKLNNNEIFCCISHYPINKELITEGCFMCSEKINKPSEIIYFTCKHAFHKSCYIEWLEYSTYDEPICLICRNIVIKSKKVDLIRKKKNNIETDITPLINIVNEIYDNNLYGKIYHKYI